MSAPISAISTPSVPDAGFSSPCAALSPEERLLALVVYSQASQMSEAKTSIDLNAQQLEKLREQVKKALEEAREAKKDAGFWGGLAKLFGGDLATLASAIAAVAAVIATGGAAAAILAVVATVASFAAEHAQELGIPTEVAMGIALAASVAALCCGDAKGLLQVGEKLSDVAKGVKTYATAATVTFKAAGAGFGAVAAGYERAAAYAHADAEHAHGAQKVVGADIDEALDALSAALERQSFAVELTCNVQQRAAASSYAVLNNWGGAA